MSQKFPICFCNGKYVSADGATISVRDLGLVRGFGLFESLRTYNRQPLLLDLHLDRLLDAARHVGLKSSYSQGAIIKIIERLIIKNKFRDALIRIYLTGGPTRSLIPLGKPSLIVLVDPLHPFPSWQYTKGISLMTAPFGRIFPEIKTTCYFAAVMESMKADRKGYTEVVYVNKERAILEGTTYNVFAVLSGPRLVTPKKGVLPGITAGCVIELAKKLRIPVQRSPISQNMLRHAKEFFITSSNRELIPVVRVDRLKIGNGKPGPVTYQLHAVYKTFLQE